MFVLDGVKLFGKVLTNNVVAYGTIFASVLLFVVALLTDVQLEVARIVSPFLAQLTA
jgi:hypothetical protein